MLSVIVRIAAKQLLPVLLFFSIIILFRGHNSPGGGFIGGLLAAAAFILYEIAFGVEQARKKLKIEPRYFIGFGLLTSLGSGCVSYFYGYAFKTIELATLHLPVIGEYGISTPLFFDIGVFFVVTGVLLTIVFTLSEE